MISNAFRLSICSSSFLYTFYVMCNLMIFLSSHCDNQKLVQLTETDEEEDSILLTIRYLIFDTCLIVAFILQHSIMASDFIKEIFCSLKIEDLERSIYNACSAGALHLMIKFWTPISSLILWNINTTQNSKISLMMTAFQIIGWIVVYSGCLMMDIGELVGIKQVIYKIKNYPSPMSTKSRELKRYFAHMRHPSYIGFTLILWIHPFMSLDRLLLAIILTVFMTMMWNIDQQDYHYHLESFNRKKRNLHYS
ncbi:nurim homolog isoform X2 [Leptopilina boulardi]|uniref:nurim homolog isoform X2 n=1 Tax=Leptopilina boulardi TaxID=63433 RepID=UPI0021F5A68E|nr:nurim homolog isoform X2 [Leptopilina boulardi]